jgi:hypothetical protein
MLGARVKRALLLFAVVGIVGCDGGAQNAKDPDAGSGADLTASSSNDLTMVAGADLLAPPDLVGTAVEYMVTVSKAGANTVDNLSLNGVASTDTNITKKYAAGSAVTIVAQPGTDRVFVSWSGGPCDASTNATCNIASLSADVSMQATFAATYALTMTITGAGAGDTVTLDGTDYTTDHVVRLAAGTTHVVYATAGTLRKTTFTGADGYCPSGGGLGTSGGCTFMMTADETYGVAFGFADQNVSTTLTFTSTGTGTVTSDPAGINCSVVGTPISGCVYAFPYNGLVTLTATPAVGSQLASWGGCETATPTTCTVHPIMATIVTVTFEPIP